MMAIIIAIVIAWLIIQFLQSVNQHGCGCLVIVLLLALLGSCLH